MIRCLDLFCGAGGSSLGAAAAGAEIVAGIDADAVACAAFAAAHPGAQTICADVRTVATAQFGEIDLLLASPPCTMHSLARGDRPVDEAVSNLAFEVVRFVETLLPRWVVVENVIRFKAWARFTEWCAAMDRLGYPMRGWRLNAADYGVPQRRERLFMVGGRCVAFVYPPSDPPPPTTAGKWLPAAGVLDQPGTWPSRRVAAMADKTSARAARAIKALGLETPFILTYYGSTNTRNWSGLDEPLRTITTIDRMALVEPAADGGSHMLRMLQPTELARAMGFPHVPVAPTRRDRVRLLGNGVCPPVIREVVEWVRR